MVDIGMGLTDEEMNELCELPLQTKKDFFGKVDVWYEQHKAALAERYASMYLVINASDFTYALAHNNTLAFLVYQAMHGPVPKKQYRNFFCIQCKAAQTSE